MAYKTEAKTGHEPKGMRDAEECTGGSDRDKESVRVQNKHETEEEGREYQRCGSRVSSLSAALSNATSKRREEERAEIGIKGVGIFRELLGPYDVESGCSARSLNHILHQAAEAGSCHRALDLSKQPELVIGGQSRGPQLQGTLARYQGR